MSINRLLLVLLAALLLPGLALAQSSRATFAVTKDFTDGNTSARATVTLSCNFGLPLTQSASIPGTGGVGVTFVLESFGAGTNCTVTEAAVAGYNLKPSTGYIATGTGAATNSANNSTTGCTFTGVGNADAKSCKVTNDPTPVPVTVHKDWVIDGEGGDQIDSDYSITLNCGVGTRIVGGTENQITHVWTKTFWNSTKTADAHYIADVVPKWDGTSVCNAHEETYDSSIEISGNNCAINPKLGGVGGNNSCTITNSVFFEGIPTLSQYGMAIMALLMLGVGFVGFRRFV